MFPVSVTGLQPGQLGGGNQIELLNNMKESITFQPLNVDLMQQSQILRKEVVAMYAPIKTIIRVKLAKYNLQANYKDFL